MVKMRTGGVDMQSTGFSHYFPAVPYLFEHYSLKYPLAKCTFLYCCFTAADSSTLFSLSLLLTQWQKMFTSLETSGKVTGDQEPTCTVFFFFHGGIGATPLAGKWLKTALVRKDMSITGKCIRM